MKAIDHINRKLKAKIIESFGYQMNFARHLGVPDAVVSRVLSGRWNLTDEEKIQWAEALEADVDELFPEPALASR